MGKVTSHSKIRNLIQKVDTKMPNVHVYLYVCHPWRRIFFSILPPVYILQKKKNLDGNFVLVMKTEHLYNVIILANYHFFFSLLKLSNYLENNRP